MIRFTALLCALFFVALSGPAHAKWLEASTDHFVIYADDREKDVRQFAAELERYHAAMELVSGRKTGTPSPSNRVVIFVVDTQRDIRKLIGSDNPYVAGFYIPRAGSSRAFVQEIRSNRKRLSSSMHTLLHESNTHLASVPQQAAHAVERPTSLCTHAVTQEGCDRMLRGPQQNSGNTTDPGRRR